MTLEAWVNPSAVSSAWRDVIYKGNDNYWLEATSENSGGMPAAGATLGSSDVDTLGTAALTANTWAFLTETYNGSTLALYMNGTLVSSLAHTGNIATSTDPLQIGGDSIYGQYFKGMIDNVRIYNTALTQAQIQTDMTTAVTSAAPVVTGETPASGATGVAVSSPISATFNEAVQSSTISITLTNSAGTSVPAAVSYNSSNDTETLTPSSALAYGTTYTATVSGAKDTAGVPMAASVTWSFTTASAGDSGSSSTIVISNAISTATKVQLGSSGTADSGNQAPDLGGFNFFANGAWWQAIGSPASDYGVAPNSAALLSGFGSGHLRIDWSTTTANGGNSLYGMPYNVVPGTQPLVPLELGSYASESDPGPVPFYSGMSIEGVQGAPPAFPPSGDSHALVMVRNETTGGIDYLYEGYMVGWDATNNSWKAEQLSKFNLITGAPRPEFATSSDAAGLPVSPLLVNYSEAALAAAGGPAIDHPFRICISPGLSMNAFVWPARHGVYSGSNTSGLPMGSRLQLTQAWYNANINSFDPIDRAVVTAMYQHGVIVADLAGGGMWLEGVNDQRWTTSELSSLAAIPDSAFQVLNTIQSPVSFTGPTSGQVGVAQTYNLQYLISGDSNFSSSLYINVSSDGGNTWTTNGLSSGWFQLDDANRGPFSFTFTPPAAGTYVLAINYGGNDWILPANITFTATASATT